MTKDFIEETMIAFEKEFPSLKDRTEVSGYAGTKFAISEFLRDALRSTSLTMYEKGREDAIKQVGEKLSEKMKTIGLGDNRDVHNMYYKVLSAVKEILSANQ